MNEETSDVVKNSNDPVLHFYNQKIILSKLKNVNPLLDQK